MNETESSNSKKFKFKESPLGFVDFRARKKLDFWEKLHYFTM